MAAEAETKSKGEVRAPSMFDSVPSWSMLDVEAMGSVEVATISLSSRARTRCSSGAKIFYSLVKGLFAK